MFQRVIVLDLTRVGSGEGVNVDFLKKVLKAVPMDVYVGGGVRDIKDLVELKEFRCFRRIGGYCFAFGQNFY